MTSDKDNLLQRLSSVRETTPSERKLLDYFEAEYPHIAFSNIAEISTRNEVSKATVTRFVRRLGYEDFRVFIRSLRDEVAQNFDSPRERRPEALPPRPASLLKSHFESGIAVLARTLTQADEEVFSHVLALVSDETRPLYLMGTGSGQGMLRYFYVLAKYARRNLHLLSADTSTLSQEIVGIDSRAVLLAQAIERHATATLTVLNYFHQQGCETVLLTNRHSSPLLKYARHTLFVHAEGPGRFKSRCSAFIMLEALLAGIIESNGDSFDERYEAMDSLRRKLNVFVQK